MTACKELSIVDLLEVQLPEYVGCLSYSSLAESSADADPTIDDILTFVRAVIPGEPKDEGTLSRLPYTNGTSQHFFGISLNRDIDSGLEHLTCFIQSQVNPQSHVHKPQNPSPSQPAPVHPAPAFTTQTDNIHRSSDNCLQPSLVNCSGQQSVLPTTNLEQLADRKHSGSSNTSKPHLSNHGQTQSPLNSQKLELQLHSSPSLFFRETQEKLSATGLANNHIGVTQLLHSVVHGSEKYCNEPDSSSLKNQVIHPTPSCKESVGKNDYSDAKICRDVSSPPLQENHSVQNTQEYKESQLKANLVCRDHTKPGPNSNTYNESVSARSSKNSLIKPGKSSNSDKGSPSSDSSKDQNKDLQGSSRAQVSFTTDSTRDQIKDSASPCSNQVKDGTNSSKNQISPSINSSKGQIRDSISSSKNQKGKISHSSNKERSKTSTTSHKDSNKDQHISGKSTSKNQEVKTSYSSRKIQVKKASASHKGQNVNNGSSSSKDSCVKTTSRSHRDRQTPTNSKSNQELKNTYHKLPFISTDEQENKDNEDPRWKEQAQLNTNDERYRLARKLWKNPCVPDPNKNLTTFNSKQLKTYPSFSFTNSRKRQRSQGYDTDDLQPLRKRQRRFEHLAFTKDCITRSKRQVMNEFLENIQELSIGRQDAKKLERSHKEKQYMLDLALEEVNAIQKFYDGLPDQDLTLTQEEVEMGWSATEDMYYVFSFIYGYDGQEFFP